MSIETFPSQTALLDLFGSAPVLSDTDRPWAYNELTFTFVQGEDTIMCQVAPSYETLLLEWRRDARVLLLLDLHAVKQVHIEDERGRKSLVATFADAQPLFPLRLQLHPTVQVFWGTDP